MKLTKKTSLFITFILIFGTTLLTANSKIKPVTSNVSQEAKALLEFLYSISGKYMLTGQHNYPNTKDRNSQFAAKYLGKTPVVWSTDMGFAEDGDTDSYLARPDIVEEAKRQHQLGSIVTICWHAVPPTADEPVTFTPGVPVTPDSLASVQGNLLDDQFKDILTPGTELYKRWEAQVDTVAFYLKKLQEAKVPVLWRPYHEMNGDWFWWGGRTGEYSTRALYKQLFDRYVNHHKLDNLIWVWSVDRAHKPEMYYSNYYPGNDYLDVLALDVYGRDFGQVFYDSLMSLSNGKPLALGEVGNPPTLDILDSQPNWTFYVVWAGMVRNTLKKDYQTIFADKRVLNKEDSTYAKVVASFQEACGVPPIGSVLAKSMKSDFSGTWVLNEEKSTLDNWGVGFLPYKLLIDQNDKTISIQKRFIVEWGDDRIQTDTISLDGKENNSLAEIWKTPQIMVANWSANRDSLIIGTKISINRDGNISEVVVTEDWQLEESGEILSITYNSKSPFGDRNIIMILEKQ